MSKYQTKQTEGKPNKVVNNRPQVEPYKITEDQKQNARDRRGYGKPKNNRSTNRGI